MSDQILATTGQRFLEKYSDNDTQYKALLAAGAKFAQDNGIKLGVALTEAQQRQLTTDLVWLVEQTVTLPDGTTETVLVPQVYLLVREGDLKGDGTLLAGRSVHLAVDGNATNSGTIGAREATVITAGNIVNQAGGTIRAAASTWPRAGSEQSGLVDQGRQGRLERRTRYRADVDLGVGELRQQLGVVPDRRGARGCRQPLNAGRPRSGVDRRAGGRQDDARLQAGRDIVLDTLTESHGDRIARGSRNRHETRSSREIGADIAAGGNLTLVAGQDINARAANVTADKQLAVGAGRDVNLTAGVETAYAYDESYSRSGACCRPRPPTSSSPRTRRARRPRPSRASRRS